jgi:exodeoxyribonuclease V alpha subunit
MAEEVKVIRGTVARLFYQSPKFCAGRLLPEKGDVTRGGQLCFAGAAFVREGEAVALRGQWVDDSKWGRQFKVESRVHEEAVSVDGLAAWLAWHGEAHGIGPVKAEKIAREFGENFAGVLNDNPEQVAIFAGVPLETVKRLAESWREHEELNIVGTKLAAYGLTQHQVVALYETFGGGIIALLEHDPYLLIGEIPGMGFQTVDEIARKIGVPVNHPGRVEAAVLHCMKEERGEGSTCAEHDRLVDSAVEVLGSASEEIPTLVRERIGGLADAGRKLRAAEGPGGRTFLALPACWKHEVAISGFLTGNGANPHWPAEAVGPEGVEWLVNDHDSRLDDSQRRAVASALKNRTSLISGGAGSGKTTSINAIYQLCRQSGLAVRLAAPTGKAARRLEEVVPGSQASTIHRLLEYHPLQGFRRGPDKPVDADVVVVDEVSMLGSELACHLLSAIGPKTAVVLVGDHHQLPPVDAGALLRDCIVHELLPLTLLAHCHRQAGPLKHNCAAILTGVVAPTEPPPADGPGPWYVHPRLNSPGDVLAYIERLWAEILGPRCGFDVVRDVQFMTPQHRGPIGTQAINGLLQRLRQRSLGVELPPADPEARPKLMVGDKVIQTKNNYDLNIMNGHQGVVLEADSLLVEFDGRAVAIPRERRGEVELAYCLTPHKMQGSEVPCAVTVCHSTHHYLLHRNWLYTACTRAQKTAVVIGDERGFSRAVQTVKVNERRTLLGIFASAYHANVRGS